MNLQQHSVEAGPGVDTSKPLLYLYDEIDPHSVDQFKDFFEAIEEGDVAIREYIELYEYEIFNDDYDDLDKKLAAMEKKLNKTLQSMFISLPCYLDFVLYMCCCCVICRVCGFVA